MGLDSLLRVIERLRDRLQQYAGALRESEMLTRYLLIDPLLRETGWDTENPEQVRPNYRSGSGSADYALLSGGKPLVLIEARSLDSPLQEGLAGGIAYCISQAAPYYAVTDGRRWEIYQPRKQEPVPDTCLATIDLATPVAAQVVYEVIALWRPGLETGTSTLAQAPPLHELPPPTEVTSPVSGDLPVITRTQLAGLADGEVVLCSCRPTEADFLVRHNAWPLAGLYRVPEYLALFVTAPHWAIHYLGEIGAVVSQDSPESPFADSHAEPGVTLDPEQKLVLLKAGRLWKLSQIIGRGHRYASLSGLRYVPLSRLTAATTLDDLL